MTLPSRRLNLPNEHSIRGNLALLINGDSNSVQKVNMSKKVKKELLSARELFFKRHADPLRMGYNIFDKDDRASLDEANDSANDLQNQTDPIENIELKRNE